MRAISVSRILASCRQRRLATSVPKRYDSSLLALAVRTLDYPGVAALGEVAGMRLKDQQDTGKELGQRRKKKNSRVATCQGREKVQKARRRWGNEVSKRDAEEIEEATRKFGYSRGAMTEIDRRKKWR